MGSLLKNVYTMLAKAVGEKYSNKRTFVNLILWLSSKTLVG